MKTLLIGLLWCIAPASAWGEDFFRPLPDTKFTAQLKQEMFPTADGIIVIKEQSLNVHRSEVGYRGHDLVGLSMTQSVTLIGKVFNEAGVKRLGSFEYEYNEYFGDEIPAGFMARARVQKPDGTVIEMPKSDLSVVVSHTNNLGEPLARKALFKVPNLMPGDVVQIEYALTEPFTRAYSGIFYYQDRMPVLFSNLAVTCQARDDVRVFSFPPERVGPPKISQVATTLGSGETRFWSVKNLNAIPDEAHAPPFEDLSVMTAFIADQAFHEKTDWNLLAKNFWDEYLDKGSVKSSRVKELGFVPSGAPVTLERVDSLYTALRTSITLNAVNSVYPLVDELDKVFEKKSGDASDLAAVFYKILQDWNVDAKGVWLRDRRKGAFESTVPTVRWFDRIGVLVRVGPTEKLYDFDRAIPNHFSTPWFIKGITAMVIEKNGCRALTTPPSKPGDAWVRESHQLRFGQGFTVSDSMTTGGIGAPVEEWREDGYALKGSELQSYLQQVASANCMESVGNVHHSSLLDAGEVTVVVTGNSRATAAVIDSFVSIRPANHALKALRDELFAPGRTNQVVLDEPFAMTIDWTIRPPQGYRLAEVPKDTVLGGFSGGSGSLAYERTGDIARVTARLDLKTQIIAPSEYSSMMQLLAGLQKASEHAINFRKE